MFVCPFHSWSFRNNGELRTITDEETFQDAVICHRPGLTPVACEERAGIIFISMADDPPALKDAIGLPEGYLENYQIDQMRVVRHVRSEWGSNWKVGVEAFYESYHLHAVHPRDPRRDGRSQCAVRLLPQRRQPHDCPSGTTPAPVRPTRPRLTKACSTCCERQALTPQASRGPPLMRAAIQQAKRARSDRLGLGYERFTDGQLSIAGPPVSFPMCRLAVTRKPYS